MLLTHHTRNRMCRPRGRNPLESRRRVELGWGTSYPFNSTEGPKTVKQAVPLRRWLSTLRRRFATYYKSISCDYSRGPVRVPLRISVQPEGSDLSNCGALAEGATSCRCLDIEGHVTVVDLQAKGSQGGGVDATAIAPPHRGRIPTAGQSPLVLLFGQ